MFPVMIVLTVLRLLRKHIKSNFVYTITSGMTAFVALTDTISGLTGVPLGTEHLPLSDMGFGWVVPALIASLISLLISCDNNKNSGR
jgi:LIVCS family branched-chain amino acid:cation transporter